MEDQSTTKDKAQDKRLAELEARLAAMEKEKNAALQAAREAMDAQAAAEAAAAEAVRRIPDKSEQAERETLAALRRQKKFVLSVNSTETDSAPVPISCNGVAYLITRDREVLVPQGVINVLNLSKVGNPVQEQIGDTIVTRFQSTKRFSYSYREATAEDESKFAGK